MSFFINLTQRAKRQLSIDFQIQGVVPKLKLIRSRAFTFNKSHIQKNSHTVSPRSNLKSPKIILKPLYSCHKDLPFQDLKLSKCTPKKQIKLQPTLDFSVSGFETTEMEIEDFLLQSYVKKQ